MKLLDPENTKDMESLRISGAVDEILHLDLGEEDLCEFSLGQRRFICILHKNPKAKTHFLEGAFDEALWIEVSPLPDGEDGKANL